MAAVGSSLQDGPSSSVQSEQVYAIAKYDFDGRNNDELSFATNDVILVTQQLDGGWWEGELNSVVGWFPSDFVGIINTGTQSKTKRATNHVNGSHNEENTTDFDAKQASYRGEIVSNFLTKEKEHISMLNRLQTDILGAIHHNNILSEEEYTVLCANLRSIMELRRDLLEHCEEQSRNPLNEQRIGQVFLDFAPKFYPLLKTYCENHWRAMELINVKKNVISQFMTTKHLDVNKDLIPALSAVFRHTDKVAISLQEIERTTPTSHADRGNLQRACTVYRELYGYCEYVRKQKDAQTEFLTSRAIEETVGKDYEKVLGQFLYVGKVTVHRFSAAVMNNDLNGGEVEPVIDRCITVFTKSILLFESMLTENSYTLRNRISTAELSITKDPTNMSVQFRRGPRTVLMVKSLANEDYQRLTGALAECPSLSLQTDPDVPKRTIRNNHSEGFDSADSSLASVNPPSFPGNNVLNMNSSLKTFKEPTSSASNLRFDHQLEMILPDGLCEPTSSTITPGQQTGDLTTSGSGHKRGKLYSGWALRAYPPPRGEYLPGSSQSSAIKMRKGLSAEEQDDALLLKIVEGYCYSGPTSTSMHNRHPSGTRLSSGHKGSTTALNHSTTSTSRPQLIVAEEEKIFVEEMENGQVVVKERSLVDTVYALKDQLSSMQTEMTNLTKTLEKEQKARRRLEENVRRSSQTYNSASLATTPKPTALPEQGKLPNE
ncbi:betaPIX coiled coil domain-containing protein [Ditylenchus destructor]|nr:betaPIX coiled coil domain-containing protein [Ditylenchus destructor]